MGINAHPQILLCQEQVQSLRRSQTPHRDGTVDQHSSTLHFQIIPALKTLEKAASGCMEGFLLKTIRRSPRNGLPSQPSQSVWRQESRKRVVPLH